MEANKPKKRGRPKKRSSTLGPEAKLQTVFMHWLSLQYPEVFEVTHSIPNSGLRTKAEGARQVAMGLKAGMPDINMPVPTAKFPGMFIELKWGDNKPNEKQIAMLKRLRALGYRCEVCYTLEELMHVTKDYLKDSCHDRRRSVTFTYSSPNINGDRAA